jgi:hypothetical protein
MRYRLSRPGGLLEMLALVAGMAAPLHAAEFLITDHGAVGNNSFDNAPVINNLINALPAEGGVIVIPAGDFRIHSPIQIGGKSNVTIRGINYGQRSNVDPAPPGVAGPAGGSKIILGTGVQHGIAVFNGSPSIGGLIVRDLAIQGGDGPLYQTGIFIDRGNSATRIINVSCINTEKGAFIRDANRAVIEDCWIGECQSPLHLMTGQDNLVADSSFGGQPGGVCCDLNGQQRLIFSGNVIFPDANTGLFLTQSESCNISHNTITGWFTGLVQIEGNMNTFTNNNVTAVLEPGGSWPADPLGRDDQYGLIRISGNDNTVSSSIVMSWQPANHVRVRNHSGDRNLFRNLYIAANGSNRKIFVNSPSTTWTRITLSGWPSEIDLNGSATARITYDP